MRKQWIVFLLAILTMFWSFFGFPESIDKFVFFFLGLAIASLSFFAARDLFIATILYDKKKGQSSTTSSEPHDEDIDALGGEHDIHTQ